MVDDNVFDLDTYDPRKFGRGAAANRNILGRVEAQRLLEYNDTNAQEVYDKFKNSDTKIGKTAEKFLKNRIAKMNAGAAGGNKLKDHSLT